MLASGKNAVHDITSYRELPDRQYRDVYKPHVLPARKARNQRKEASKNRTAKGVFLIESIIKWKLVSGVIPQAERQNEIIQNKFKDISYCSEYYNFF
jgi:hypothetical protein